MSTRRVLDPAALEALLKERASAVAAFKARVETAGMTRPARSEAERTFLGVRGSLGPFVETGEAATRSQ